MLDKVTNGVENPEPTSEKTTADHDEIMPFYATHLTPKLIEEAITQLNETDEVREKALADLRKLIETEKNLVTPTDDLFLLAFLRARKFRLKDAFKLLKRYWSFRKEYRYIYDNPDAEKVKAIILRNFCGYLPFRDRNGCIVGVFKAGMWNPEVDCYEDMFRAFTALFIASSAYPATQVAGYRIILDGRNISWDQVKYFTPNLVLLFIKSTQFSFPGRFKGVHIIYKGKFFKVLWRMAYPLLTNKVKNRVFMHGEDLEQLREFIHPSVLPIEYGGDASTFDNSKFVDIMEQFEPKILELRKYGYKD